MAATISSYFATISREEYLTAQAAKPTLPKKLPERKRPVGRPRKRPAATDEQAKSTASVEQSTTEERVEDTDWQADKSSEQSTK